MFVRLDEIEELLEEVLDEEELSEEEEDIYSEMLHIIQDHGKDDSLRIWQARKGDGTKVVYLDGGKGYRMKLFVK